MGSLKQFVDTYLANKKIEDYESWVATYGKDTTKQYGEALAAADRSYAKDVATYGSRADRLLSRGLTNSGYSDYLSGKAMESYANARQAALSDKQAADAENKRGYARYLTDAKDSAEKEAKSVYKNAVTSLFSSNIQDEKAAIAYLSAFGIDEETARRIAKDRPVTVQRDPAQANVLGYCITNYFGYDEAYLYAKGCGLSEKNAEAVAEAAAAVYQTYFK